MLLRRARPFEVKLFLICLNNKCFDFLTDVIYFDIDGSYFRNFGFRAEKSPESVNEISVIV